MKRLGLFTCFALIGCEGTPSLNPGPFERHVLDGIALNEERIEAYAALTDGKSRKISKALIHQEKVAINIAQDFDRRADLSNLFVSLTEVPSFRERGDYEPFDPKDYLGSSKTPSPSKIRSSLRRSYRESGFAGLVEASTEEIKKLDRDPHVYCMLRHFLESIRRAASRVTPDRADIIWDFVHLHLKYLGEAFDLDQEALPIQARGIPILCQDVPRIPL